MNHAYMGKVLWVDLTTGRITTEAIPDDIYRRFLSGTGLAAWLLYRRIPAGADPLGPDNILGFVSGVLTSSGSLFTGRWMAVGKSPLTGTWGDANCGGNLGPAIKACGVDGIFFTGQSNRPVYLYADTNGAELRDATHLWGQDAVETERLLVDEHGSKKRVRVACIGMAGEHRSLIAGIVNHGGRLAARSGLGAVMGAKRLKAVALCGSHRVQANDPKAMKALSLACNDHVAFQPPFLNGTMTAYLGVLMRMLPAQIELDGMLYKIMLSKWEGIGNLLADGAKHAAQEIGRGAETIAIHAGGQELGMHDGRYDPGFALHNVVEPTPGRHTIGSYMYYEMFQLWRVIPDLPDPSLFYLKRSKYRANREKAAMGAACSQYMNVVNGAGGCLFGAFMGAHRIPVFDWLNAATGWEHSPKAYLVIGHRIQTVRQLFNIKQGVIPKDIRISKRVLGDPPQQEGANTGVTVPLEKLRRYYWSAMGYDPETGVPTPECLALLDLKI